MRLEADVLARELAMEASQPSLQDGVLEPEIQVPQSQIQQLLVVPGGPPGRPTARTAFRAAILGGHDSGDASGLPARAPRHPSLLIPRGGRRGSRGVDARCCPPRYA